MSTQHLQAVLVVAAAIVFAAIVTVSFRRSKVSFRYWLGWLLVAGVGFVAGIVLALVPEHTDIGGLSVRAIGIGFFLLANLLVAVQLSISISGQARMITTLAQEVADLRRRIEERDETAQLGGDEAARGDA